MLRWTVPRSAGNSQLALCRPVWLVQAMGKGTEFDDDSSSDDDLSDDDKDARQVAASRAEHLARAESDGGWSYDLT